MVKLQWVILRMVVEGLCLGGAMLVAEMIADSESGLEVIYGTC